MSEEKEHKLELKPLWCHGMDGLWKPFRDLAPCRFDMNYLKLCAGSIRSIA